MRLILEDARISFCQYLFQPGSNLPNDPPKYKAEFLIPKGSEDEKRLNAVMEAEALRKWKDKGPAILADLTLANRTCKKDGDGRAKKYDGYPGHWAVRAINNPDKIPPDPKPRIVDRYPKRNAEGELIELTADKGRPYGGCYVRAILDIWAQDNPDPKIGKRMNCKMTGVQFMRDGDAFGSSSRARDEDFEDIADTGEGEENPFLN